MKKSLEIILVALVAIIVAPAMAQSNMFPNVTACKAAYFSGNFAYYTPKDLHNRSKNPVDGVTKKAAPLAKDACVNMSTTSKDQWVVREKGVSVFRWWVNRDGSLGYAYADDACANSIYEVVYLDPPDEASAPEVAKSAAPAVPPVVASAATVSIVHVGCSDLTPRQIPTPAKGMLRDLTTITKQDCGNSFTQYVDHQETTLDATRDIKLAEINAKVAIAEAKAEAKAANQGGGFWHGVGEYLTTPMVYPVGYGYGGYGGGYNTGYGGGYSNYGGYRGGRGGQNTSWGGGQQGVPPSGTTGPVQGGGVPPGGTTGAFNTRF